MGQILAGDPSARRPGAQEGQQYQRRLHRILPGFLPLFPPEPGQTSQVHQRKYHQEGNDPDGVLPGIEKAGRPGRRRDNPADLLSHRLPSSQIDCQEAAENQQHLNIGNAVAVYPLKRLQGIGNGIPQKRQVQDKARQLLGNQRAQGIDKDHTAHGIQKRRHIQVGQVKKVDHRQIEREKHSLRQGQTVVFSQPLAAS